jgi:hypothetical protein
MFVRFRLFLPSPDSGFASLETDNMSIVVPIFLSILRMMVPYLLMLNAGETTTELDISALEMIQ